MDVALLFLGEDENGLHALEEGGDGAAAQELGAAGLIALGGVTTGQSFLAKNAAKTTVNDTAEKGE